MPANAAVSGNALPELLTTDPAEAVVPLRIVHVPILRRLLRAAGSGLLPGPGHLPRRLRGHPLLLTLRRRFRSMPLLMWGLLLRRLLLLALLRPLARGRLALLRRPSPGCLPLRRLLLRLGRLLVPTLPGLLPRLLLLLFRPLLLRLLLGLHTAADTAGIAAPGLGSNPDRYGHRH
ncbi:MAG: hypothetical protein JJU06_12160 [Ectothiorhodospiraceae bacterium]|nr:hypothetical protein [Ectothiorhodospiraceae bacterium]MCH8503179.1 hypothetical protein [Ectothiorhodospiraceae bacterium]